MFNKIDNLFSVCMDQHFVENLKIVSAAASAPPPLQALTLSNFAQHCKIDALCPACKVRLIALQVQRTAT